MEAKISHHEKWRLLRKTIWSLLATILVLGLLAIFFRESIEGCIHWLNSQLGLPGLVLMIFASDSIVTPIPPDLILLLVSQSHHANDSLFVVSVLGVTSCLAGHLGYGIGKWIRSHSSPPKFLLKWMQEHQNKIQKWGALWVVMGALTPIPYSITCWSAGYFEVPYKSFSWATTFRFFRVWFYYLIIAKTWGAALEIFHGSF